MKDQNEFLKEMEQLQVPDISAPTHQKTVKMTIMNAERSATLGIWLIVIPCYFLLCVFIYYYYNVHANWFGAMFKLIISLEQNPYIDFIAPLVLVVLPVISIIINALAITNVKYQQYGTHQKKTQGVKHHHKNKILEHCTDIDQRGYPACFYKLCNDSKYLY